YRNMRAKEFSPRQISVSVFSGAPAYSPVFMQEAGWVAQQSMHDLDDRGFNDFMFRMAQQQFSIIDHSAYYVNGVRLHAAVFQRDSYTRMYYGDYTKVGIEDLQTQKNRELWWVRSIDATRGPDGFDLYSVILHYGADITFAHFGMTASEFGGKTREYNRQGRHLLQVKAHSGLFSGVWSSSVLP
ncbi:MAG TPA: hypothetical protein PKC28_04360, partial [Bdellovibrionales bacterium]|nr:hypothetical protein [Bdellovibrionales bacterium]